MEYKDIASITGMPGLYRMIKHRQDGMIVRMIGGTKTQFVPSRRHTFSPLESISIYTIEDGVMLREVFRRMQAEEENGLAVPAPTAEKNEMREYFTKVISDHDAERVYVSDIKKIIKWYAIVKPLDILKEEEVVEEAEADSTTDSVEESK